MKPTQTTQPATVNALVPRPSSPFIPRPFHSSRDQQREEKKGNRTGLPDDLKASIENLSGVSLDDVKVHYDSRQPSGLDALAYTQGSDIHVGPGQERHLPHEAWHVVQQKQGRVKANRQWKGAAINDSQRLETDADRMANRLIQKRGLWPGGTPDRHAAGCGCPACASSMETSIPTGKQAGVINPSPEVIQLKCPECKKAKGHAVTCSRYQPPPGKTKAPKTAEEIRARMASKHHPKTGRQGTPKARLEKWKEQNLKDIEDRMKKDDDDEGAAGGGIST
jgi:hypothetical protein